MIKVEFDKIVELLKNIGIFEKIKQQGLVAILLGLTTYIMFNKYNDVLDKMDKKEDYMQKQNLLLIERFEKNIDDLNKKLMDCQNSQLQLLKEQRHNHE